MERNRALRFIFASLILTIGLPLPATAGVGFSPYYYQEQQRQATARFNLVKAVQQALTEAGYDPGPADGIEGSRTAAAVSDYQRDNGLSVDGMIGPETLRSLGLSD